MARYTPSGVFFGAVGREPLNSEDASLIVDAVYETYRADSVEEFPRLAMHQAGRLVPNDLASFNDVDPLAQTITAVFEPADWPLFEGAFDVFGRLQGEHPVINHYMTTGDGSAWKISDFSTNDDFREGALYREFYARVGIDYQIAIGLPSVFPRVIGLALNRAPDRGDFGERDRTLLNLLRPHLSQAYEHVLMRERLVKHSSTLARLLAARDEHAVLLDDPLFDVTGSGLALLAEHFGAPQRREVLPTAVRLWVEQQRASLAPTAGVVAAPPQALTSASATHRLVVRFVPGRGGPDAIVAAERTMVTAADIERIGLSARESEVVYLLSLGATNANIAERLHIAPGTVKKHLDNIYRKLGVTGRVQAVSLALELLSEARSASFPG